MPYTLSPITRRDFLAGSLAAGAALATRPVWAADEARRDPHVLALVADTHIDADPKAVYQGSNMTENLRRCAAEILGHEARPSAALINGDLAKNDGRPGDYAQFVKLLAPLREAKLPIHMTLGNHDSRENFYRGVFAAGDPTTPVEGKYVTVVSTPRANWFLLDSLLRTLTDVHGGLGEKQIEWLAKALDARDDRPAIVYVHHHPQWEFVEGQKPGGLLDAPALFDVLAKRKHVKAYFSGHGHYWGVENRDGIHLVHLPASAYVFDSGKTATGWVLARMENDGINLTVEALDKKHAMHGRNIRLRWRAA